MLLLKYKNTTWCQKWDAMATLTLQPPALFDFSKPDDWPKWIKRFEQYRVASGLSKDSETRQVSTLLYCLGDEAEDVLSSTNISEEDKTNYSKILENLNGFFKVRKNVILERAKFNRRYQLPGESAEQYITTLYRLVENCQYGALTQEMIRDRLVVGISDKALSEQLCTHADLTLEKAKTMIRQREAIHEQRNMLQKSGTTKHTTTLDQVKSKNSRHTGRRTTRTGGTTPHKSWRPAAQKCKRCGNKPHPRDQCPAKDAECYKCKKKGHFSSQCLTTTVKEVTSSTEVRSPNEEDLDLAFLSAVVATDETSWTTNIRVNGETMKFKVDTGAEVTAVTKLALTQLGNVQLHPAAKTLCGPDRKPLKVLGQTSATLSHCGKSCIHDIFVVEKLKHNLLGLPAIKDLNLLVMVNHMSSNYAEIVNKFPSVFTGLGSLSSEFEIQLKPDVKPFALYTPRKVPYALRSKVKAELDRMEAMGVISKVEIPTPWCAGMVVVPKKDGKVRICVDLKPLNASVKRETHPLPKVDDTLAQLSGAKIFSKLDANSGFWQIPLAKQSHHLTTFITPFGRFCFNKMPFGISSAPEHFQRRMNQVLSNLPGVLCLIDDILVYGRNIQEHNERLEAVLNRIQSAGITLNQAKCEFGKETIKFLGHIINSNGVSADPQKIEAIVNMKAPSSVSELRRFLGMTNQLGKFSSNIAEMTKPLRELLNKQSAWLWGPTQEDAFHRIKDELSSNRILAWYDPSADTKVSADASAYRHGAVLLQKQAGQWKPLVYASRSLTETESRYVQIEKEALASTWACEHFSDYILGKSVEIESDHKPLVPLLNNKILDTLPPRILRFRLRLMRFDYTVSHVPGKSLYTADTLSRAPLPHSERDYNNAASIEEQVLQVISQLPASKDYLQLYRQAQASDALCTQLLHYCHYGWPPQHHIKGDLLRYWDARSELTSCDGLLLYGSRIVVPKSLQQETLSKIHQGHQGIEKCRLRVSTSVWWPGVSREMQNFVQLCSICRQQTPPSKEPMISTPLPKHPWERVGTDLFELHGKHYIVIADYYSRYHEVIRLTSTISVSVIAAMKSVFSRHGIPDTVVSDNGPQYDSKEMKEFASLYGFNHVTTSPYYPQSNGFAERMVKTVKKLLNGTSDMFMALLSYRATPLPWSSLSPGELLMGRRLKTDVPQMKELLIPKWSHLTDFAKKG